MTITPQCFLTFLAQVTATEAGILSNYRVGLGTGTTNVIPEDCDAICVCTVEVILGAPVTAAHLYMGSQLYVDRTIGGTQTSVFPPLRNAEGQMIVLDKIYALAIEVNDFVPAPGFTNEFVTALLEDVETINDTDLGTSSAISDPRFYLQGEKGFAAQMWPNGLKVASTTKLTISPDGSDAAGTLKIAIMGKAVPVEDWADATVYVARQLVRSNVSPYRVFICTAGHTSATANDKPDTGTNYTDYWSEISDYQ